MKKITADSFTLTDVNGNWLGQVIITNDGMFASVTDYGNLSYAWRAYGDNFKEFLIGLNVSYFGQKMVTGMAYMVHSRAMEKACYRFAEMILPALQKALKEELNDLK